MLEMINPASNGHFTAPCYFCLSINNQGDRCFLKELLVNIGSLDGSLTAHMTNIHLSGDTLHFSKHLTSTRRLNLMVIGWHNLPMALRGVKHEINVQAPETMHHPPFICIVLAKGCTINVPSVGEFEDVSFLGKYPLRG